MAGFIRRFNEFPGREVLAEIEGIVTVDADAPGTINGISAGVACCVGEFPDVTYAVAIDANGVVTTSPQPTEIFSGQDMITKVGGWDETLGEFGGDGGSGFLELKNKSYSRLVVVPINLAASQGARLWRKLPTNTSATDASPVVPLTGGVVPAGREFRSGASRVRLAKRVQFSETADYARGTDGTATALGSTAATQPFGSATGAFTTVVRPDGTQGVQVNDVLVLGVIGGAAGLGANADTFRVVSVASAVSIVVAKQDGTVFDWTTAVALPWRLHVDETADTGDNTLLATQSGYRVPVRPLDATIAINTLLTPTIVPEALTATSADALSGLTMRSCGTTGIVYVAAKHAPNVASSATLDAEYIRAIDALLDDDLPEREVNIVWAARSSTNIGVALKSHALQQKAAGVGRIALESPALDTLSLSTILGDTAPGVGANRYREGIFNWPGIRTFVSEAVGTPIKGADGLLYTDGIIDTPSQSWGAAILSKLAPERNPGQAADPVKTIMATALGIQRGVTGLGINAYKQLKSKGVMAPRNDRTSGMIFQSGVTRSLKLGEAEIYTRRFSFFVEDSIAAALVPFSKELMNESLKDKIVGAVHDFFEALLSELNPAAARIAGYEVNAKDGNTKELTKAGIFVVKYEVEMIPLANTIVQQASVGYGVLDIVSLAA